MAITIRAAPMDSNQVALFRNAASEPVQVQKKRFFPA